MFEFFLQFFFPSGFLSPTYSPKGAPTPLGEHPYSPGGAPTPLGEHLIVFSTFQGSLHMRFKTEVLYLVHSQEPQVPPGSPQQLQGASTRFKQLQNTAFFGASSGSNWHRPELQPLQLT